MINISIYTERIPSFLLFVSKKLQTVQTIVRLRKERVRSRAIHSTSYITPEGRKVYSNVIIRLRKERVRSRAIHSASYIQNDRCGFLTNAEYHTRILLNFLIDAFVVAQVIAPLTFNKKPVCPRAIHSASYIQQKTRLSSRNS